MRSEPVQLLLLYGLVWVNGLHDFIVLSFNDRVGYCTYSTIIISTTVCFQKIVELGVRYPPGVTQTIQ